MDVLIRLALILLSIGFFSCKTLPPSFEDAKEGLVLLGRKGYGIRREY